VIAVDDVVSDDPDLLLPHPRAHERGFVLVPWAEIEPAAVLQGFGPIVALLEELDSTGIELVGHVS
jgi:2-amino-4-hydroxy-6-hydroxymethyldihydropteridine diphosphokinase